MRTLFGVAVLLLAVVVGLGFYQGWFHLSTNTTDRTSSATISVDQSKIRADEDKAKQKVEDFEKRATETTADRPGKVNESERRP